MKTTLPSVRVSERTLSLIDAAIKKHNQKSLVKLSTQEFRRLSYELLAQLIIQGKEIPIQLTQS